MTRRKKLASAVTAVSAAAVGVTIGLLAPDLAAIANPNSQLWAQQTSDDPTDSCVALQEVTTGKTEIRKRIENRLITQGNWNTDFLVPSGQEFSYFVAILTPEHNAPFHMTPALRFSNGSTESLFRLQSTLTSGETYSVPFQSPTGRQPAVVNMRVGGVNGNFYTIGVAGCQ